MSAFVVTTSRSRDADITRRAREVAQLCGAVYQRRSGTIQSMSEETEWVYVVSTDREEMFHQSGASFFVHAGLFAQKTSLGIEHPLICAVAPSGPCKKIVDATLGLAGDALHLAYITGAKVIGFEASVVVSSLLHGGLAHLKRGLTNAPKGIDVAAARVSCENVLALDRLRSFDDDSVDVVYVDPMMPVPPRSQPGFDLFRNFARADAFGRDFFAEALRVAPRVVVKTRGNHFEPPNAPYVFERVHRSKRVAYWVATRASAAINP